MRFTRLGTIAVRTLSDHTDGGFSAEKILKFSKQTWVGRLKFGDSMGVACVRTGYCRDVLINRVVCDRNTRQGMSVIGAVNLMVRDSEFSGTNGSAPMAGIDFEVRWFMFSETGLKHKLRLEPDKHLRFLLLS
eukprot:COSAG06_NODE_351_length_16930_cov_7.238904_8_plen_133_part_00